MIHAIKEIKKPTEKMILTSLRMCPDMFNRLHAAAKSGKRQYNEYIRSLLEEGLKRAGY